MGPMLNDGDGFQQPADMPSRIGENPHPAALIRDDLPDLMHARLQPHFILACRCDAVIERIPLPKCPVGGIGRRA